MNINTDSKPFLIKSDNLEKLRPSIIKVTNLIKKAVSEKRQIVIRHHDDCDGYTAGLVLEKAIKSIINDHKPQYLCTRQLSRSPYFDYIDALREANNFMSGYKRVAPLIILTDLGSNSQSMKSIQRLSDFGFDFIIVDHHRFDIENKEIAKGFVNPHEFDMGSSLNAGALATEIALFINPLLTDLTHLPALSGVADKSSGTDFEEYLKLSGYTKDELMEWGLVIDHDTYYLRFNPRSELMESLFFPNENQKIVIKTMSKEIDQGFDDIKLAAKKFSSVKNIGNLKLVMIEKHKVCHRDYASSKIVRITHELYDGPRITFALTPDSISYRADEVDFKGPALIKELKEKFPFALINGGGHDVAGSIRFNEASRDEVIEFLIESITKI
jgi:archaea-specific RecJ-like exonuclease